MKEKDKLQIKISALYNYAISDHFKVKNYKIIWDWNNYVWHFKVHDIILDSTDWESVGKDKNISTFSLLSVVPYCPYFLSGCFHLDQLIAFIFYLQY